MASLLRKLLGIGQTPEPAPLKGRRPVRRLKMYTAMSGYVYEYVYEGYRDHDGGREHVFNVSGDRKTWFMLSVSIPFRAIEEWERAQARTLNEAERYAVAKLALFAAFDERESPAALREPVDVDEARVAALLESIDL